MTEHARTCDRPSPVVRPFVIAGTGYLLTTCAKCGAQRIDRTEHAPRGREVDTARTARQTRSATRQGETV